MRILILIDDLRGGGTENVLASRLAERSPETEALVVTLFPLPSPDKEHSPTKKLSAVGVETRCLRLTKTRYFSASRELREITKKFSPNIAVCLRDVSRALFPTLFARLAVPVAMCWDNPLIKRSRKYFAFERQAVANLESARFAPYCSSAETAAALEKAHGIRAATIIPNCYDHTRFKYVERTMKANSKPLKIVSVCGDRPEKNNSAKIALAEILRKKAFDFKLTIVGNGIPNALEETAKSAGVEPQTRLLDETDDIPAILAESDIFLSTSRSEGSPVAILEALATGLPCIAFEFPGLLEIAPPEALIDAVETGRVDQLAERVGEWKKKIHSPEFVELSRRSAESARRFAADNSAKEWESFLRASSLNSR